MEENWHKKNGHKNLTYNKESESQVNKSSNIPKYNKNEH